jgi:CoA-dependent NAD(P)H sulfur oxidoreductase
MRHVIIGGNAAGMSVAAKLKRSAPQDDAVVVYEKSRIVSFGSCGLPYYVGGYFSDHTKMFSRLPQDFIDSGIDLKLQHEVVSVDTEKKELTVLYGVGESFTDSYDTLVLATGASAIVPPLEGVGLDNIFSLRTLHDGDGIKDAIVHTGPNAVVVGGGFIGLEIVEALKKQGKQVRLIELENRLLKPAVGREISDLIIKELHDNEVSISLEERVVRFEGERAVTTVVTDKGSYPADLVVLSIGIRPETKLLKDSGIEILGNGAIVVDGSGRSSIGDVYAVGDCAAVRQMGTEKAIYSPLATSANKLGRVVGEILGGGSRSYPGSLNSACVKVFDLEIARTGDTTSEQDFVGSVVVKDKNQTDYYPGQQDILVKLVFDKHSRRIMGAEIAGKNGAALRIDTLAMAIQLNGTVEDLALADLCYAPPFARTWDVLNIAGNVAL